MKATPSSSTVIWWLPKTRGFHMISATSLHYLCRPRQLTPSKPHNSSSSFQITPNQITPNLRSLQIPDRSKYQITLRSLQIYQAPLNVDPGVGNLPSDHTWPSAVSVFSGVSVLPFRCLCDLLVFQCDLLTESKFFRTNPFIFIDMFILVFCF